MGMELGDASDLNFKLGTEQVDKLYLGRAFVWPVDSIVDFAASDNLREEINFTWTDNNDPVANSYDLYEAGTRIYDGITNGQTIAATPGTATFHVKALYDAGQGIDSNEDQGTALEAYVPPPTEAPSYISDFQASDTLEERIMFWWSNASGNPTPSYSIYRGTTLVRSGAYSGISVNISPSTDLYHVKAINSDGIVASNSNSGTSVEADEPPTELPDYIDDFVASDDLCDAIRFTWTTRDNTYTTDIIDGTNTWVDVQSGHTISTTWKDHWFQIRANNPNGYTNGNSDNGSSNCDGGGGNEDSYGTPGCYKWTAPSGVTQVTLCMIGGGGSGGASKSGDETGGGHRGTVISTTYGVSPGTEYDVCVGNGGNGRVAMDGAPNWNGTTGGSSSFGSQTANGGAGGLVYPGTNVDFPDYYGNGGSYNSCYGSASDGLRGGTGSSFCGGGQAGFANGTNGKFSSTGAVQSSNASMGAGSGGATGSDIYGNHNTSSSGDGGDGYVKITW